MGVVWRARREGEADVAIKVLKAQGEESIARFRREARIVAALRHPAVVRALEVLEIEDEGVPAIVMPLLSGESLGARLERLRRLPVGEAASVGLAVLDVLAEAHRVGIVHRDLKPDNVFLAASGEPAVFVLDFGIAKVVDTGTEDPAVTLGQLTRTAQVLGTPHYMAPEVIFGEKDIDARVDVWALGVILYEALSGVRPFEGENLGQVFRAVALEPLRPLDVVAPDVPLDVARLVTGMLAHARAERTADLEAIAAVLRRHATPLARDEALAATHADMTPMPMAKDAVSRTERPAAGRRRAAAGVVALSAVAILGLAALRPRPVAVPLAAAAAENPSPLPAPLRPIATSETVTATAPPLGSFGRHEDAPETPGREQKTTRRLAVGSPHASATASSAVAPPVVGSESSAVSPGPAVSAPAPKQHRSGTLSRGEF
jgi:serine/threonine protein kinase